MAVDYAALKKGGFMRQKQKNTETDMFILLPDRVWRYRL